MTLAIDPPVTIKTEELEAVFRSKPTTIVSIGIYNPPSPMPPALDIEAAMKQKTPSTIEFGLRSHPCHTDTNENIGSQCSEPDRYTNSSEYLANLSGLLNSLAANGPIQDGFYSTEAGKGASKIYGLAQCRGDISATDCAACIKNVIMVQGCSNSRNATLWFKWCFLRYSNTSFLGEWDQSGMASYNDTNFEDPKVVPEALNFTNTLVSTTPNQPLMYRTAVLDVGQNGKRYGMAQCTRDLSKIDCGMCLESQLMTYKNSVGNKRNWDIYGFSCSLWYHDYQFHFNISTPARGGSTRSSPHFAIGMAFPALVFLSVLSY
ncbi:hypothetical protein SADUNF_Sadunf04G0018300 [Salix dunnii]|uniref:Gnk2-homologous domain-containing protein n=1 Tax=Salix dunnii TaxID=1413687 RepID=A0A835N3U5_9ROSI|nr:hypothetical protein SADUNF_Sadunf04G0018300 [Salix dunnii]